MRNEKRSEHTVIFGVSSLKVVHVFFVGVLEERQEKMYGNLGSTKDNVQVGMTKRTAESTSKQSPCF